MEEMQLHHLTPEDAATKKKDKKAAAKKPTPKSM